MQYYNAKNASLDIIWIIQLHCFNAKLLIKIVHNMMIKVIAWNVIQILL